MSFLAPRRAFDQRNLLAFPVGRAPGFDPTHPASYANAASVVCLGTNTFVSLLTGAPLVTGGSPPVKQLTIGPALDFSTNSSRYAAVNTDEFYPNPTQYTFAAILQLSGLPSSQCGIITSADSNLGLRMLSSGVVFGLHGANNEASFSLAANIPYFVAYSSSNNSSGTNRYSIVAVNLQTGQVYTTTGADAAGSQSGWYNPIYFGNIGDYISDGYNVPGAIAAAVLSFKT